MSELPKWRLIAQLGDVNPIDYGGYFIYEDETGVYEAEAEYLEDDGLGFNEPKEWTVYRFELERFKEVDGFLIPFKYDESWPYHFTEYEPWFVKSLDEIAGCVDLSTIRSALCSVDPRERAFAYEAIGQYHGFENLDSDPLKLNRAEVEERYKDEVK